MPFDLFFRGASAARASRVSPSPAARRPLGAPRLVLAVVATLALLPVPPAAAQATAPGRRAITWDDVAGLRAVADPQLSPDGTRVLYTVRVTDVAANRRVPSTWLVAVAGGAPRRWPNESVPATEARWSPDGKTVAYVAQGQLWLANADGSAPRRITSLTGGAGGPVWSPTGDRIAFTSTVYPECPDDACNAARDKAREESKVKARVTETLLYRHWNTWGDGMRSHLFVVAPDGSGLRDLTAGARYDVPVPPFGGSEGYAFSPDGFEVAYTAKDAGREDAWSTDVNVYTIPVAGGAPTVITAGNKGADQNPVYSPDGRFIAYASQARAGFEAVRWRLMVHDRTTRAARELLPAWDRNAESYFFAPDSRTLFVGTGDRGRDRLFRVALTAA
ncbi:MAG TPA: hypothetical protein VFV33_23875, partial [Gemmatimonadaceae bacterium]|nr:hypothetical protein [Gemmatimonadaceae bacterium]